MTNLIIITSPHPLLQIASNNLYSRLNIIQTCITYLEPLIHPLSNNTFSTSFPSLFLYPLFFYGKVMRKTDNMRKNKRFSATKLAQRKIVSFPFVVSLNQKKVSWTIYGRWMTIYWEWYLNKYIGHVIVEDEVVKRWKMMIGFIGQKRKLISFNKQSGKNRVKKVINDFWNKFLKYLIDQRRIQQ